MGVFFYVILLNIKSHDINKNRSVLTFKLWWCIFFLLWWRYVIYSYFFFIVIFWIWFSFQLLDCCCHFTLNFFAYQLFFFFDLILHIVVNTSFARKSVFSRKISSVVSMFINFVCLWWWWYCVVVTVCIKLVMRQG